MAPMTDGMLPVANRSPARLYRILTSSDWQRSLKETSLTRQESPSPMNDIVPTLRAKPWRIEWLHGEFCEKQGCS